MNNTILELGEPLVCLDAVAEKHGVNPATVNRWILKGCRSMQGEMVRLEGVRRGCKWLTSYEAMTRFFAQLSTLASLPVKPGEADRG